MREKVLGVCLRGLLGGCLLVAAGSIASAASFSFNGTFTADDNVQLFHFTVGATSDVILRTWSYAGGVDAAGATVPEGGFDPILALFDSTGAKIDQNDDGGTSVPADSVTGSHFDTFLEETSLAAGTYTVSVMEYDNFANGPNLSDGFSEQGQGDFTGSAYGCSNGIFCDVNHANRTADWEFDILGVNSASTPPTSGVPEPGSIGLLLAGISGLAILRKRRLSH